jgi:hypothetical protein
MCNPRLEAKSVENIVDLAVIEVDGQIVWPIAGALLVAGRRAGHLVVIAVRPDEIPCARFVCHQAGITRKLQCAGHLDENVLEAGGEADATVCFALPRNDCLRAIKIVRRSGC